MKAKRRSLFLGPQGGSLHQEEKTFGALAEGRRAKEAFGPK